MSVLFPKVNQPRQWDFRPRYYDPEKEKHKERVEAARRRAEAKAAAEGDSEESRETYHSTLHRGSFREARKNVAHGAQRKSRLAFWIALLAMLLFCFYFLF